MSITVSTAIYLHGDEPLKVALNTHRPESPFVSIDLSDGGRTYLVAHNAAEADVLIRAAVAAKDLLLATQEPAPPPVPAYCAARDQSFRCGKALGHLAGHAAYVHGVAVHRWGSEPAPAGHCPICGGPLADDGSHISRTSGAHIPAEPQQVST